MVVKPQDVYKNLEFQKKVDVYERYFDKELSTAKSAGDLLKTGTINVDFPSSYDIPVLESVLKRYEEFWAIKVHDDQRDGDYVEFIPITKEGPR